MAAYFEPESPLSKIEKTMKSLMLAAATSEQALAEEKQNHRRDIGKLLTRMIEIRDDLERIIDNPSVGQHPGGGQVDSLRSLDKVFKNTLLEFSVREFEVGVGDAVDAARHKVVELDPGDGPPGAVTGVIKKGYTWNEEPFRPAEVKVRIGTHHHGG